MREKYHLSATEEEILRKLWGMQEPPKQVQLLAIFNEEGKNWSRQTLNTFLIRLEERGLIKREKHIVSPVYNEEEFGLLVVKETMDIWGGGKTPHFFAAFAERGMISKEETKALQERIQKHLDNQK